jgi:hypothetical protein
MNKTAIKNFAIWARNKLIAEIQYKAGLIGITDKEIKNPLPQSTQAVQFFEIGTKEPYAITGVEIAQRCKLAEEIRSKAEASDYPTAYKAVVEAVAYTWFNRLIAIRFMEVNDYLPSRIRVLSSESAGKIEPDLVNRPFEADFGYSPYEKDRIVKLQQDNQLDELFRLLFIKQCNALNALLPALFEKTDDFTELLLNISFTDQDGVVRRLVSDIAEDDFNVAKEGQVEIIGWLYQYYNTEPKDETFALLKKNVKITKERIPAATQLFTPDWIVRYMVENSLGRLWLEGHPNDSLKSGWKYYLDEAEQEAEVQAQLAKIREEYQKIKPEEIKVIDPCMGSGHILVYAFDVLMQIYESCGYSQRDAAKSIVENNLFGLDIDQRAYQLAYFALLMKARQYNRRILGEGVRCNLYAIEESNGINRQQLQYFGQSMDSLARNVAMTQMQALLDAMKDAKEYGSIIKMEKMDWPLLREFAASAGSKGQMTLDAVGLEETQERLRQLVEVGELLAQKYDVVVTNPPYMGSGGMGAKLAEFVKKEYPDTKSDLFAVFIEKGNVMAKHNAYNCMVTMQSWMFLSSFEIMRQSIVLSKTITNLMHMENMVMGIAFGTAVTNFRNNHITGYKGTYCHVKLADIENDEPRKFPVSGNRFSQVSTDNFSTIPSMPIAYWATRALLNTFLSAEKCGETRKGMVTADNDRFVRYWFEIAIDKCAMEIESRESAVNSMKKWFPYQKGGEYRKWYGNHFNVVNWENDGHELLNMQGNGYKVGSTNHNLEYVFHPAICWNKITSGSFSARYSPKGFLYDDANPFYFVDIGKENYVLAALLSRPCLEISRIINPTINFQPGNIKNIPIIISNLKKSQVDEIVDINISISRSDWDSFEISWNFKQHPLLRGVSKIAEAFYQWQQFTESQFAQLKANEEELNSIFIDIYGLQDELTPEVAEKDVTIRRADLPRDIRSFLSYAAGCMFGRYSLDVEGLAYAGGEWDDNKYSSFIPDKDNILPITDEEYFEDDVVGRFVGFVKQVYGPDTLEENLDFIANALGNKGSSSREVIRQYFLKDFFKNHCQIYQKRPIYWLFDSGKENGFKALVYLHRYDADTIGKLRVDYLHRMQRIYESEIVRMQDMIDNGKDAREVAAATKRKEKLQKQLKETKAYDEKIAHLALARIELDLDDGVVVNYEKLQTGTDGRKLEVLAKI